VKRDPIEARLATVMFEDGNVPEWIMWMPGGRHELTATTRGKPVALSLDVTAQTAGVVQQSLDEYMAGGKHRPFIDFFHKRQEASGWPERFEWRGGLDPGVYLKVEWSKEGRAAIAGRTVRAFSPSFFAEDGRVVGAPFCMGGLVNDPAFNEIAPIWASKAGEQETSMASAETEKMELQAANAKLAELQRENEELKAQVAEADDGAELEAAQAQVKEMKARLDAADEAAKARAKRDAEAIVAGAVARGAIPQKDEATQKHWVSLIEGDPKNAELLARVPAAPALSAGRITRPAAPRSVEIVSADTNDVLRAYMAARTPREKGLIYARDISPRIAKGENVIARFPIEASNTLGTLVNALVSQRTLELVYSQRPMLANVVTDFSDEVRSLNDTVKTRTIGLPTMQTFNGTVSETADVDVTVTLDLFKEVKFTYAATELAGTARDLVKEHAESLAVGLGIGIVDAMAALITEANFGTSNQTIQAAASCDFGTITSIAKAMNAAGVPPNGRFAWIDENVAEALANDELMATYFDRSSLVNAYSHWKNVKGFGDIWEYPALPANSCNLIGFFAHRNALIVASRLPANPTTVGAGTYIGRISTITDPISGLSVLSDEYTDSSWNVSSRLVVLFGVDVGNAAVGHTLVSAA